MRRIQTFNLDFGVFKDVIELLKFKVCTMELTDRFCIVSYDEMVINSEQDYDKFRSLHNVFKDPLKLKFHGDYEMADMFLVIATPFANTESDAPSLTPSDQENP
ncbi:hypothetical protein ABEB36_010721 [Hypothenemus hampei]|uniref:Uncharacterized protein n=1 Tax=Hypothenemus hampei TaxID=57062 RepID=A0ABD1ECU3_HYPHA